LLWLGLLGLAGAVVFALSVLVPGQTPGAQDNFEVFRLLGLTALVSSGLLTLRRIDLGKAARGAAWWVTIMAILVLGYAYRDDARNAALRLRAALFPAFAGADGPRSVVVGRSEGGQFYVMGAVNGAPVRFLIDTGASDIVLSPADAARARVSASGPSRPAETANGVGSGAMATAASLTIGTIRLTNVPIAVNGAPISVSLLGTSFLKRLESFEVRGDQMILRGSPG
jgi:aspartyl protease family protein